ncbi:MAG: type IV secretory system conjugative DNA transfer family protein [Clostridia bacterium]|nr:type IV secretory system conjugative DNA transfer family protein [Clostridia bacterium]
MNKDYKGKIKGALIWIAVCYVAGVVVTFVTKKSDGLSFTDNFTSTYAIIGLCAGILIALMTFLGGKTYFKESQDFEGTTQGGDKMEQHYNARFITENELATNPTFMPTTFKNLPKLKKTGTLISTLYTGGQLRVNMYPEMHALIIGTTGSGKTTFVLEPAIRCYAHSAEKPCMVITDPKGELYNNHSVQLRKEGYRIIVLDLRNPYSSSRWNPMDNAFMQYNKAHNLHKEVKVYKNANPTELGYKKICDSYGEEWYGFNKIAYPDRTTLETELASKSQTLINEAENELREIAATILPIESKTDTSWEQGAQDFVYSMMLAMLEDSQNPELGMTREKFNFYNVSKICTTRDSDPDNMMGTLKKYIEGRDVLSKVKALATTVVNNAPNTTRSFLGVMQPKIAIFQDMGVCYATSATDISFDDFIDQPTVLFIKVPDEKESRHCIATMCISQIYKKLIEIASNSPGLKLKKPVYFILDEFANLPKIPKFDSMITVARSRRIFFEVAIQSYSQLDNKYTKEVADTIKGNCNIQIFIGTEDQKTREEFSKMCGDVTLKINNTSVSRSDKKDSDANRTTNTQNVTRPLIEPYELGQLPYDVNIVKIYGKPAIKTKMTQWFKVPVFSKEKAEDAYVPAKFFDENAIRYDVAERNRKVLKTSANPFDFDF